MDVQQVAQAVWPDLRVLSKLELVELEAELVGRLNPRPLTAAGGRPGGEAAARVDAWLRALAPKSAQEAAVVIGAVAALLTAAHAYVDADKPVPPAPPTVNIIVEAPDPVILPPVTNCDAAPTDPP